MLDAQTKSSFRITEDSKFFCKLLSKESSVANPSFRVSGSVPFMWELRPGTPKHVLSHSALPPPLTPPPSYNRYTLNHRQRKFTRSNLFNAFLARISSRRIKNVASVSSSHSSTYVSSPSSGSPVILVGPPMKCQETSHPALDSEFDEKGDVETPAEALCFRIVKGHRSRGCA